METMNTILAETIVTFRKEKRMTQSEFAEQLGVTYQAVSKWENAKSAPDIFLLPKIADVFACSLDDLFGRENPQPKICDLPFEDDDVIRGVVYRGHTLLTARKKQTDKFVFAYVGQAESVQSECNVTVKGDVNGGCSAGHTIAVTNNCNGGCSAGHTLSVGNNLSGGCSAGFQIHIANNLYGSCDAGHTIACGNNIENGNMTAGNKITVKGDIRAKAVRCEKGTVTCNTLQSDQVTGKVVLCKGWKKDVLQEEEKNQ